MGKPLTRMVLITLLLSATAGACYSAGNDAATHNGNLSRIADHPYGDLFDASTHCVKHCAGAPDLRFACSGHGHQGRNTYFECEVMNCGSENAVAPVTVEFYIGSGPGEAEAEAYASEPVRGLDPDAGVWLEVTVPAGACPALEPGDVVPTFEAGLAVDPLDQVHECDEADNVLPMELPKSSC